MKSGKFKNYLKNTSGNFSVIFVVSLLAIIAVVGAAVDYNSMIRLRGHYQDIADSAVLATAKSHLTDHTKLLKIARQAVDGNNTTKGKLDTKLTIEKDNKIRVHVTGKYDTVLMGVFGLKKISIGVVSESQLGVNGYINLVLVLDVTGSMGRNSRLINMKDAVTKLLTKLQNFKSNHILVSVVPFARYVSLAKNTRNEPWINVPQDWTETFSKPSCYLIDDHRNVIPGSCKTRYVPAVPQSKCSDDGGKPYPCGGKKGYSYQYGCKSTGPKINHCPTAKAPFKHKWFGVVGSRDDPHHKRQAVTSATRVPGYIGWGEGTIMLPLTQDLDVVKTRVMSASARGETYMPAGLMWGWRALSREAPFTEAAATPKNKVKSIMVFMTDGENTTSIGGSLPVTNSPAISGKLHNGNDRKKADSLTAEMCNKIKADNIDIYTIAFEVRDVAAKTLVENCASGSESYYDASNGAELHRAFNDIGRRILNPSLTR